LVCAEGLRFLFWDGTGASARPMRRRVVFPCGKIIDD
jgi:hypothetical protein